MFVVTIIANPFIVRISSKKSYFSASFCRTVIGGGGFFTRSFLAVYLFYVCSSLLLYQTSHHGHCKHHFVLWVHDDHSLDFLPFHR